MFDHLGINCTDVERSKKFYDVALQPLGVKTLMGGTGEYWGYGVDKPNFWIAAPQEGKSVTKGAHIAFEVGSRDLVDQFYAAAISAGGADNGKPGIREQYHKDYYGAFVLDPDGNNVEVVCHKPG